MHAVKLPFTTVRSGSKGEFACNLHPWDSRATKRGHKGSRSSFSKADVHVLRSLKQTGRPDLPSHQVCDHEDEFAHVERFRQVSLITGDEGALSVLRPRKRSESQRGNPIAPRFIGAQFPD